MPSRDSRPVHWMPICRAALVWNPQSNEPNDPPPPSHRRSKHTINFLGWLYIHMGFSSLCLGRGSKMAVLLVMNDRERVPCLTRACLIYLPQKGEFDSGEALKTGLWGFVPVWRWNILLDSRWSLIQRYLLSVLVLNSSLWYWPFTENRGRNKSPPAMSLDFETQETNV